MSSQSPGSASSNPHFNLKEADGIPEFKERGEREGMGGWDYYECPACGFPICSFCDCPKEDCRWYDAEAWREAVRKAAEEREDVWTGSLEVDG